MAECDHKWVYRGRYGKVYDYPLPGGGACAVEVFDVYFCEKCLAEERRDTRLQGYTTYGAKPWEGEWIA